LAPEVGRRVGRLKEAAAVTKRMGINAIMGSRGINCHQIRGGIVVLILVRNAFR
jgi:hypothetical protein